jgi:hypothetical protein
MPIDPKRVIEAGSEVVEALSLAKKTVAFLPKPKPEKARRRADWDPQRDTNRRVSDVNLRLKRGIWFKFHFRTGYGKFEVLETSDAEHLMDAFRAEAVNYQFSDRTCTDSLLVPATIALPAADFACARWIECPREKRCASVLTDELGEYVLSHYNVRMIDRRQLPQPESPYASVLALLEKARGLILEPNRPKRRKQDWEPSNDRRKNDVGERLRVGIWLQFHRKTGYGMTEVLDLPNSGNLMRALITEGDRYEFSDPSSPEKTLMPSQFAAQAADIVCAPWKDLPDDRRRASVMTDEIAKYVVSNFTVRMVERRRSQKQHAVAG